MGNGYIARCVAVKAAMEGDGWKPCHPFSDDEYALKYRSEMCERLASFLKVLEPQPSLPLGNTKLVEGGILTDESDVRAHVSVVTGRVYVFSTENGRKAIESGVYRQVTATQPGVKSIPTSKAFLVPPTEIDGCISIVPPKEYFDEIGFSLSDSTSEKGKKATDLVYRLIDENRFPVPATGEIVEDKEAQINGKDLVVLPRSGLTVQVKCDYACGEKDLGGTGNLYLEVAECNPLRRH